MTLASLFVIATLALLIVALVLDKMRPGLVLFSGAVVFLCAGILTPRDLLEGFSNKGMITVALLFLVSEGVRRSGLLEQLLARLLPKGRSTVKRVLFAPMIKRWAERAKLPATKFLIPLSYVTILGGMCTLIGTSTNLVVHGMVLDAGYEGFTMFELGLIGVPIAIAGMAYILFASKRLLPDDRPDSAEPAEAGGGKGVYHRVEAVLAPRFPGINRRVEDFDFKRHYGATLVEIKRGGRSIARGLHKERFREGDTLVLMADDSFMQAWGESSVFVMLANGKDAEPKLSPCKRWLAIALLALMIVGATVGELPAVKEALAERGSKFEVKPMTCSGLEACKLAFLKAAKGIGDFNFIEGMACEGGCVQGPAQLIRSPKNQGDVDRHAKQAEGRTIEEAVAAAEELSQKDEAE